MALDLTQKKILLTGGGGFLGQHVVRTLKKHGVPDGNISTPSAHDCDLRVRENCENIVRGQEVVIHLAGTTGDTGLQRAHPAEMFYDNLSMGVELMEAARKANILKFVTIGSATEYPENTPVPFKEEHLWDGPLEPNWAPYTIAKKMLLVQAQAYRAQYGWNGVHLVLANMYGPGKEAASGFVIANIIARILTAQQSQADEIEVWGTGKPTRDFLYVEDAAEGVILAASKYDKPEPVNLSSGHEISIKDLAELIARLMDFKGSIRWNTQKPDGQMRRMLDGTRAQSEFGFQPATSFEDGLRKTIEWHRQHFTP